MKTDLHNFVSFYSILSLCALGAYAQQKPLLEPSSLGLVLSATTTYTGRDTFKSGDTTYKDVGQQSYSLQLAQTLYLTENDAATINLQYHQDDVQQGDHPAPLPDHLYSLTSIIEYTHEISKAWSILSGLGASSNVAGHGLLSRGWGVDGYVVGVHMWTPNFLGFTGLAYDSLSKDWKFIPVGGFIWTPSPGWTISLGIPKTALTYAVRSNLSLALEVSGDHGTFVVHDEPHPGAASLPLTGTKLEYTEARLGVGVAWKISQRFALSASAGSAVGREFRYTGTGYKLKSQGLAPFGSLTVCTAF